MPTKCRCSICHRSFLPDPRVGARQRTCLSDDCRREQRRQTQASWRERNPSYFADYYLQSKQRERETLEERAPPAEPVAPREGILPPHPSTGRWSPPPFDRIAWDSVRQAFTPEQVEVLRHLARLFVGIFAPIARGSP